MIAVLPSPLGMLTLTEENGALTRIDYTPGASPLSPATPLLREAEKQLNEYFAGKRTAFSLPLRPRGTAFQQAAWAELQRIPYGETITYGQQAARMGCPRACRAVGGANGRNPLPIVIPCHRVVAAGGQWGGYTGGLDKKQFLLALERSK